MSVVIADGRVPLDPTAPFPCFLIHGGCGPEDPKDEAVGEAATALADIVAKVKSTPPSSLHTSLGTLPHDAARVTLSAARLLEDNPQFNAGFGAALQSDGVARVSASFMESVHEKFSAVMNVTKVAHPSELAFYLQQRRFSVLDSIGATDLARELKIELAELTSQKRFEKWVAARRETLFGKRESEGGTGTIGCVSIDGGANLAAVTSTGGVGNETVGRVGDSPTVAGNYCSKVLAVSCTGYGEQILNQAFAARLAVRVQDGMPLKDALHRSLTEADVKQYGLAAIAIALVDGEVHWGAGTTETFFVWAGLIGDTTLNFKKYLS